MAENETNKTTTGSQTSQDQADFMSKIKGFFHMSEEGSGGQGKRKTKAFLITRRESVVSMIVAICVVIGGGIYGWKVLEKYEAINNNIEPLRTLSTYNVKADDSISSYIGGNDEKTIDGMIAINNNIEDVIASREAFKKQEKDYYEILLQNIYLPSLNIWKDPYTKNFDTTILGQKYLESDKFQDLYLIEHWSDFIKYVGNDADYNTVESITIGDKTEVADSDYFYTPITVSFKSPNKRSFLLLVNKLSMTSNSNNIALLNEFFFYLLVNIKEKKSDVINELMQEYWEEFSSSSDWDGPSNYSDLTGTQMQEYQDKVIGYNLYHRINDGANNKTTPLIDEEIIVETIRENTLCNSSIGNRECFYKFREKYRNLPYLAYTIGLGEQSDRVSGLLNFLQDLPPVIAITNFSFKKHSDSSFLNNDEEQYEGNVEFYAYGRNITNSEIEETASKLGKLCFGSGAQQSISPQVALDYVNKEIASLGGTDEIKSNNDVSIMSLGELQGLFTDINNNYSGLSTYNKMIKLFELWRMMNDANLCSQG